MNILEQVYKFLQFVPTDQTSLREWHVKRMALLEILEADKRYFLPCQAQRLETFADVLNEVSAPTARTEGEK